MIFKALKRLFSKSSKSAVPEITNQYISANDQKRAQKFAKVEVSKQELEHAQENKKLTNAEEELRYEVISALYSGIYMDEEDKNKCIDSFARSTMTLEEIRSHVQNILEFQNSNMNKNKTVQHPGTRITTKLPQKSLPDDSYIY